MTSNSLSVAASQPTVAAINAVAIAMSRSGASDAGQCAQSGVKPAPGIGIPPEAASRVSSRLFPKRKAAILRIGGVAGREGAERHRLHESEHSMRTRASSLCGKAPTLPYACEPRDELAWFDARMADEEARMLCHLRSI
jgi:hypothetical protein